MIDRVQVFGELQQGTYERIAPGYFPVGVVREHAARYRWAARHVRGKNVLDVGCGTAYGCQLLAHSGARLVVGVDLAFPALQHGRQFGSTDLVCASILKLPFSSSTFEVVTCFEVIEHVSEQSALLEEIVRVLDGRGILVVSTPNRGRTSGKNPYHVKELSLPELMGVVAKAGLTCAERSGQHWGVGPALLRRVFGVRRIIYSIENAPRVFRMPETIAQPSVYLLVTQKGG